MSHLIPTHDLENQYPHDEVSHEFTRGRSEEEWFSIITGIPTAALRPNKSGRLFGPRDAAHPV